MQSTRPVRAICTVIAALATLWLAFLNWRHPVLRLASAYANVAAFWLLLWLPWAAGAVALIQLRQWARRLMLALAAGAIIYIAPTFFFVSLGLFATPVFEPDPAFNPLRRLPLPGGGSLVVYLNDCGAPCPFIVVVRQERMVAPGVLLVRDIFARRDIEDVPVEIFPPDRVRVDGQDIRVRPWVYW